MEQPSDFIYGPFLRDPRGAPVSQVATHSRIKPVIRFLSRGRPGLETVSHLFRRAPHNWQRERAYLVMLSKNRALGTIPPRARFTTETTSVALSVHDSRLVIHESGTSFGHTSGTPTLLGMSSFFRGLEGHVFFNVTQPDVRPASAAYLPLFRGPRVLFVIASPRRSSRKKKYCPEITSRNENIYVPVTCRR